MPITNLSINGLTWYRICPKDVQVLCSVSREDGNPLGWSDAQGAQPRSGVILWDIFAGPPTAIVSSSVPLASGAVGFGTTDTSVNISAVIPNFESGDITLRAQHRLIYDGQQWDGYCAQAGASVTVTNYPPTINPFTATLTTVSVGSLGIHLEGQYNDECPGYCTTNVNGLAMVYDGTGDYGYSYYPIGNWSFSGTPFAADVSVGGFSGNYSVVLIFTAVTTDPFGRASEPAQATITLSGPARRRFMGNE